MKPFHKTELKDGLRLLTIPIEHANSVTCLILVGTGSKHETKDINGISHFLEHMFFKGTEKRPTTLDISETLDSVGGQYNAFTSKEVTGYWAKVDKRHYPIALDWISDIFLHSKFDATEIEREKGVIIEELNMYLDTPTVYVSELFEELLYGDQPAGWRIVGEKETIQSFDRQKIVDYFETHYSTENIVLCVAGAVDAKQVEKDVKALFETVAKRPVKGKEKVVEQQSAPGILLHEKKTDQTHFCLGVRAYDMFDGRKYALSVLSVILGGNMSSRLFIKVRERNGLAYSIHTSVDTSTDTGYLVTQAGIDSKNLEKSVQLILEEYRDMKEKLVDEKELQKAKEYIKGAMALSLDSSDSLASYYSLQELLEGTALSPEEKAKKIDAVTAQDVQAVAKDIFRGEKLNLSVIGPFSEEKKVELGKLLVL